MHQNEKLARDLAYTVEALAAQRGLQVVGRYQRDPQIDWKFLVTARHGSRTATHAVCHTKRTLDSLYATPAAQAAWVKFYADAILENLTKS